jgi:hypothetical protein
MKKVEYSGLTIPAAEDKQLELDSSKKDEATLPNFSKEVPVSSSKSEYGNSIKKEYNWKKSSTTQILVKQITYCKEEELNNTYRFEVRDGADSVSIAINNTVYILRKTTKEIAKALYSTYSSAMEGLEGIVGWIATVLGNYYVISKIEKSCWAFDKRLVRNGNIYPLDHDKMDENEKKNLCEMLIRKIAALHSKGLVLGRFTINSVLVYSDGIKFTDLRGLRNSRKASYGVEEFKSLMQYLFALGIVDVEDRYFSVALYHSANELACNEWYCEKTGKRSKESLDVTNEIEKEVF